MKVLSTEGLTKLIDLIKSSFISNEDTQATVAVDAVETTAVDAVETNVADESSLTVGSVINQRDNTTAIKTWTGTLAQYNAIATKDNNTLYNITDDVNMSQTLLETLYPVGAIYIGTMVSCPLAALFGTWTKIGDGRVLQNSDSNHAAGTTIEAGLPNHTHSASSNETGAHTHTVGGSDSTTTNPRDGFDLEGNNLYYRTTNINTSSAGKHSHTITVGNVNNNNIYGNSTTVQPPAFVVNIWQRTA